MATSSRLPDIWGPGGLRRMLDEDVFSRLSERWPFTPFFGRGEPWAPAVDVIEKENQIIVKADLPGVKKEDVSATIEDGTLIIRAERKQEEDVKKEGYRRMERSYGRFERVLPLPEGADADAIKAAYRDGVLELTIPVKREQAKPAAKKIAVE